MPHRIKMFQMTNYKSVNLIKLKTRPPYKFLNFKSPDSNKISNATQRICIWYHFKRSANLIKWRSWHFSYWTNMWKKIFQSS